MRVEQVVYVRDAYLRRKAGINRAALRAFFVKLFGRVVRIDEVLRRDPQAFKICGEERVDRILVERARDADARRLTLLEQFVAPPLRARQRELVWRVGDVRRVEAAPDGLRPELDEVRVGGLDRVHPLLDHAHVVDVFDQPPLAGVADDQPFDAGQNRYLGLARRLRLFRRARNLHVNEGAQTFVLTEKTSRVLVSVRVVADLIDLLEPDEARPQSVIPEPDRLNRRAYRARFATVFVHGNARLNVFAFESRFDEIHLRLDGCQVMLRAALQNEVRAERRDVRDLRDVEPDVLGQHRRQPGHNLFRLPALPLKVNDVRLHKDRAAVAEGRHRLRAECDVGVIFDLHPKAFGGGLQEVAVARRALRVKLEVFDLAVFQNDQLDILPADVNDHVHFLVELKSRFSVRDRFDQRDIGREHVFQNVFGVPRCDDAHYFERGPLVGHLFFEFGEDFFGVFDGIAFGELIGLDQHVPVLVEQHGFGRSRTAVEADKAFDDLAREE